MLKKEFLKKFRRQYPQFKKFKFWQDSNRILGQAKIGQEFFGNIYAFDFKNKTVIPL